ncbi:hypothetical protein COCOBI_02-6800 [Coccomyxa sp. Obi]|nr:hypothetical protein COCOBI_02-6800 [Coccomyxa sp. Obi]
MQETSKESWEGGRKCLAQTAVRLLQGYGYGGALASPGAAVWCARAMTVESWTGHCRAPVAAVLPRAEKSAGRMGSRAPVAADASFAAALLSRKRVESGPPKGLLADRAAPVACPWSAGTICAPVADPPQAARGAPVAGAPCPPSFAPAGRSAGGRDGLQNPCSSGCSSFAAALADRVIRTLLSPQSAGNSVEGMGDWNPEGPIGQIVRTTAESQKIVAARPLYFLQHRVRAKSSARDLPQ